MSKQNSRFKINFSFGYILKNIESGALRYFHPSYNNNSVLNAAELISDSDQLSRFLETVSEHDFENFDRPDTKWRYLSTTNITFYVNKLRKTVIGQSVTLPPFLVFNQGVHNLTADFRTGELYQDRLCIFRCLSLFFGFHLNNLEADTQTKFRLYCQKQQISPSNFPGVSLHDLLFVEDLFEINVMVYELAEFKSETVCRLIQNSRKIYPKTMKLNLFENHFSYIFYFEKYSSTFQCLKCDVLWYNQKNFNQHIKHCQGQVKYTYKGGVFRLTLTIFEELLDLGIPVPKSDRFYPYFSVYDFECILSKENLPPNTSLLEHQAKHIPLSCSLCSNISGFRSPTCYISDGDSLKLVEKVIKYLEQMASAAFNLLKAKYQYVFDFLSVSENVKSEKLKLKFEKFLKNHIVLGFNSGSYDLNLIKKQLIRVLLPKLDFVIKRSNHFMCIKTETLRFLDIKNYIAPGFSYDKFIKAYDVSQTKFFFPYEYMDSLEKLNHTLPNHEAFYSNLKESNISLEDYQAVVRKWQEENWTSLRDLLLYYNNLDVQPFVEAVEKCVGFYQSKNLDLFKESFSGITKRYLSNQTPVDCFFSLIDKKNADLHQLMLDQLVGGPSIVFKRLVVKKETFIKSHLHPNPKICQIIRGYDVNSLYLWALSQTLPVGYFMRYKEEERYHPKTPHKFGLASYQWLSWIAVTENKFIQHSFNISERRLTSRNLPVDGFCEESKEVFEFLGCLWHGHGCRIWQTPGGVNPVNGKTFQELRQKTEEKIKLLEDCGFRVRFIWECQWKRLSLEEDVISFTKMLKSVRPRRRLSYQKILKGVQSGKLFGFVLVDIYTPNHLKQLFNEFPPIFKNAMVGREDVGELMKGFAEENGLLKKPRKMLISSYFGDKILLTTPLAKWYLDHGLVITKIYEFVEYTPEKPFEKFGLDVSDKRRGGDVDSSRKMLADMWKLIGNSGYSSVLLRKDRYKNISYHDQSTGDKAINSPRFVNLDLVDNDLYEVKNLKKHVIYDLPIQIGMYVYSWAKLKMLEFVYDYIKKYIPDDCYEFIEMDTDLLYLSLCSNSLDDVVKPELREKFFENYDYFFPSLACEHHKKEFIKTRVQNLEWVQGDCCQTRELFDKRTPGLLKLEFFGSQMLALAPKTYISEKEVLQGGESGNNHTIKKACKGLSTKLNKFNFDTYLDILETKCSGVGVNKGFVCKNHQVFTYTQKRSGLGFFYGKRKVLGDGISTTPLDL